MLTLKKGVVMTTVAAMGMALTLAGSAKPVAADSVHWDLNIHLGDGGGRHYYRDYRPRSNWRRHDWRRDNWRRNEWRPRHDRGRPHGRRQHHHDWRCD